MSKIDVTVRVPARLFQAYLVEKVKMTKEMVLSDNFYFRAHGLDDARIQAEEVATKVHNTATREVIEVEEIPPDGIYFPTINERAAMMFMEMFEEEITKRR